MDGDPLLSLLLDHPEPWTSEDLQRFPEKFRAEVIDGMLIVESNPFGNRNWTREDLARLPEGNLFEIIDGVLFVNAQPNPLHQSVADELCTVLKAQIPGDLVAIREIGIELTESTVGPDISLMRRTEIKWTDNEQPASSAVLVVEVASPTTERKDRLLKAEKYAEAGIPGYWRVELDPITVIAYALRDGAYVELGRWTEGETVEVDEPVQVRFDPATLLP